MTVAAFDHPILSSLFGDAETARHFSVEAEVEAMLRFEAALALAQAEVGLIPDEAASRIAERCENFRADVASLAQAFARDGVVVPGLVKALRAHVGGDAAPYTHYRATSQDVVDSSLVLRLQPALAVFENRIAALISRLQMIVAQQGAVVLMGRTRMQRALPITVADKLRPWREPLVRDLQRFAELKPRLLVVQFGGAVGDRAGLDGKAEPMVEALARRLDLRAGPCWHVERDAVGELAGWLSLTSATLGKIGADVCLMAQNEIGEVRLAESGGSSAMPHKANPVKAEALVAMARFNAALVAAVHQALPHENERSGASWSLEWLTLPQMMVATGAALKVALKLCAGLTFAARA